MSIEPPDIEHQLRCRNINLGLHMVKNDSENDKPGDTWYIILVPVLEIINPGHNVSVLAGLQ